MHKKPHLRKPSPSGRPAGFDDDLNRLRGFGSDNKETLGELLFHFFRRYAYDLDYDKNVVSVREGKLISKEGKKWHLMQNNRLCVEEPFNTERNLGNTADDTSFRGIHLELRRAFDLVKDADLDGCLEEYTFPATEEKVWEKPAAKPPPVLSRSRSQSQSSRGNRGGYGNRGGGRHGPNSQRNSGRRSSSAAAFNKFALPQISLHGLPASGRDHPSREYVLQAHYEQLQLHHELFNKYQFLQAQEQELRILQAQTQIHAQMQAQGSTNGPSLPQHPPSSRDQSRMSLNNQVPLTDPLRSVQFGHSFQYPQVPGTPQQNIHTQPSSPSMKSVQPDLRRSVHRSSVADNTSANNRSHSQPARPLPLNLVAQNVPQMPTNSPGYYQYQHNLRQQQLYGALEIAQNRPRPVDVPFYQDHRRISMDQTNEESVPKEYVGYWVNDSPPQQGYREDQVVSRVPAYQDLHPRVRGVPPNFGRLRDTSRSPSPSPMMPFRDRSFSVRSASSAPPQPAQSRFERSQPSMLGPRNLGPPMVNGTEGWTIPDYSTTADTSSHTTTLSETTSNSDDRQNEIPRTTDGEILIGRGFDGGLALDDPNGFLNGQHTLDPLQVPLGSRNGNFDSTPHQTALHPGEDAGSPNVPYRQEKPTKLAGGLGLQFGEHEIRRSSLRAEEKVSPKMGRSAVAVPPSEPKIELNPSVPQPLLSPVREVRTPSPLAKRTETMQPDMQRNFQRNGEKYNLYIPPFAELVRAKQEKQRDTLHKPNGIPSSYTDENVQASRLAHVVPGNESRTDKVQDVPESPKGTTHHPQMNGWQQQSGKKGRKNKSRPSSGQFIGEQMPIDESERKGG